MKAAKRKYPNTSPWFHAQWNNRDYITPEDVTEAIENGAEAVEIYLAVLGAIASKSAEDPSCCASVAIRMGAKR